MDIAKLAQGLKYYGLVDDRGLCIRVDRKYKEDGAWRIDVAYGRGFQTKDTWDRWTVKVRMVEGWEEHKTKQARLRADEEHCSRLLDRLGCLLPQIGLQAQRDYWNPRVQISGELMGMEQLVSLLEDALAERSEPSALETLLKS